MCKLYKVFFKVKVHVFVTFSPVADPEIGYLRKAQKKFFIYSFSDGL